MKAIGPKPSINHLPPESLSLSQTIPKNTIVHIPRIYPNTPSLIPRIHIIPTRSNGNVHTVQRKVSRRELKGLHRERERAAGISRTPVSLSYTRMENVDLRLLFHLRRSSLSLAYSRGKEREREEKMTVASRERAPFYFHLGAREKRANGPYVLSSEAARRQTIRPIRGPQREREREKRGYI